MQGACPGLGCTLAVFARARARRAEALRLPPHSQLLRLKGEQAERVDHGGSRSKVTRIYRN
jgi:hypothetical protein